MEKVFFSCETHRTVSRVDRPLIVRDRPASQIQHGHLGEID
jgi:hypothetical protein